MQEKVMQKNTCTFCNNEFTISNEDLDLLEMISPKIGNQKFEIPFSKLCPNCREQNRLAWINIRNLYKRKCDATGKDIISMFSPDKNYKVYDYKYWDSDNWDALDYGMDFDFNRPFFEQFEELLKKVPFKNLIINSSENCDYNNIVENSKNCYMCFDSNTSEDTFFCDSSSDIKNSFEISWSKNIENSYEILDSVNMYKSYYCNLCSDTNNSYFCYKCNNCDFCFLCSGLINKKYCILNKQYTKEEYEKKIKQILSKENYLEYCLGELEKLNLTLPQKSLDVFNNQNSLGNNVFNSKDCYYCFNVVHGENFRYSSDGGRTKNVLNSNVIYEGEGLIYNSLSVGGSFRVTNSAYIYHSANINYSYYLQNCNNCFGSVGLKQKNYCIFNKQYSPKEYEELVLKIIKHMKKTPAEDGTGFEWGRFFPSSISPFGYNETVAMVDYPLPHPSPLLKGKGTEGSKMIQFSPSPQGDGLGVRFNWSTYEAPFPKVEKIIPGSRLPNNIKGIPDDILNRAVECKVTKKPFKIIAKELEFYRKHNLPVPKKHPDTRYLERMSLRKEKRLYDRECMKCNKAIKSTFSPEKKEIVYCEECYDKEIY